MIKPNRTSGYKVGFGLFFGVAVFVWFGLYGVQAATKPFQPVKPKPVVYYNLYTTKFGSGATSAVTSEPSGVTCGSTCIGRFVAGTRVTLRARALSSSQRFLRWGGACSGTAPTCTVMISTNTWVNAHFNTDPGVYNLSVTKDGQGTVISVAGAGEQMINCGTVCSLSYRSNIEVTLRAQPADGYIFNGWSGCGAPATQTTSAGTDPTLCKLRMTSNKRVTAVFTKPLVSYVLSVTTEGKGTVVSEPGTIDCGEQCLDSYEAGAVVKLVAKPADGYEVGGWDGKCEQALGDDEKKSAGTIGKEPDGDSCQLTMNENEDVAVTFVPLARTLTVSYEGVGAIYSADKSILCGDSCTKTYDPGTSVTLLAEPAQGYVLSGWSKNCTLGLAANQCQIVVSSDQTVTAIFEKQEVSEYRVNVTKSSGGTVTSDINGINCGKICVADYGLGTKVRLTATPDSGYVFSAWSGACSGVSTTCTLLMNSDKSVTASFSPTELTSALLSVVHSGIGTGRATASVGAIDCGKSCSEAYTPGFVVRLFAQPNPGSTFVGWSSNCSSSVLATTCDVVMNTAQIVTATWSTEDTDDTKGSVKGVSTRATSSLPWLTVLLMGPQGSGTVTSDLGGIACGSMCSDTYAPGMEVMLFAKPAPGYSFTGWGGACNQSTGHACTVVLLDETNVAAFFK